MGRKSILITCLCFLILPVVASANMENSLPNDKSRALQFSINDNFSLSSFNGSTISYLNHSSLNKAWRYGLSFGASIGNSENNSIYNDDTTYVTDVDNHSINLSLNILRLWYPNTSSKISIFYGLGPYVSVNSSEFDNKRVTENPVNSTDLRSSTTWNIGGKGIFGALWMVSKNIGLHTEYGTNLVYNYGSTKITRINEVDGSIIERISESVSKGFKISSATVKFGLSVYF